MKKTKKVVFSLLACIIIFSAMPLSASHERPQSEQMLNVMQDQMNAGGPESRQSRWFGCVNADWLAVRTGPGTQFHQITAGGGVLAFNTLVSGSTLPAPSTPGWMHITSPVTGYVSFAHLREPFGGLTNPRCTP